MTSNDIITITLDNNNVPLDYDSSDENIIAKQGRKPYDKSIPRGTIPDKFGKTYEGSYDIPNWISRQSLINSLDGKADPDKLERYIEIKKSKGYIEIFPPWRKSIPKLKPSTTLCYLTKENTFRSGGFLLSVHFSNKMYKSDITLPEKKLYLLYRGFSRKNATVFPLQEDDIQRMWVKLKKQKIDKSTQRVILPIPYNITNYYMTVPDDYGNNIIIKYFRDNYDKDKFLDTEKWKKIQQNGWAFTNGTQNYEGIGPCIDDYNDVQELNVILDENTGIMKIKL